MNGTVSISLEDFDNLRGAHGTASEQKEKLHRAAKELEVFLSFLATRESIMPLVEEFNRQSATCRIDIVDGRAKIVFRNE
tara:strand:+ start:1905 stop:2144 length:240 start_codon:yes stop_codon:yes gene_type:complete